jgi:hypothetical protein
VTQVLVWDYFSYQQGEEKAGRTLAKKTRPAFPHERPDGRSHQTVALPCGQGQELGGFSMEQHQTAPSPMRLLEILKDK